MSRKKRKSIFDVFFDDSIFNEWEKMFKMFEKGDVKSGYSISITQTPSGTEIHVKAGENVDVEELKRNLEAKYPGAKIIIEGGSKAREIKEIREIAEEEEEGKKEKKIVEERRKKGIIDEIARRRADIEIIEEEEEEK
ncbi:MAG: hypothetical protein N3E39_02925 [Candidatus Methanomethylicia archaeon]|nr:hypothetical protein [Candidatus Methanomethylicia archaeon]